MATNVRSPWAIWVKTTEKVQFVAASTLNPLLMPPSPCAGGRRTAPHRGYPVPFPIQSPAKAESISLCGPGLQFRSWRQTAKAGQSTSVTRVPATPYVHIPVGGTCGRWRYAPTTAGAATRSPHRDFHLDHLADSAPKFPPRPFRHRRTRALNRQGGGGESFAKVVDYHFFISRHHGVRVDPEDLV